MAFLTVLFSAMLMRSCATRIRGPGLNFVPGFGVRPRTVTRPMIHRGYRGPNIHLGPRIHAAVNLPHLRMSAAVSDDDNPWAKATPPTTIYGVDTRQLLQNWEDSLRDPYLEDDKAMALEHMRDVITDSTGIFHAFKIPVEQRGAWLPEVVGLVPEGMGKLLLSGSSAVGESVSALGMFKREQLKDDSQGSLFKKIVEHFGHSEWVFDERSGKDVLVSRRERNTFGVFQIEGVADAPGLPFERSARVLLAKMARYAQREQRLVVVPAKAYKDIDGTDLTEYYVRLGFEKVEMKEGQEVLVYMEASSSPSDLWVGKQQLMVGMNLWTGKI